MKIVPFLMLLLLVLTLNVTATHPSDTIKQKHSECYEIIYDILKSNGSFKNAVYITETSFRNALTRKEYDGYIDNLVSLITWNRIQYKIRNYHYSDSTDYLLNRSIFSAICDTIRINLPPFSGEIIPFSYNLNDPNGRHDWTNVFVTKLLTTHEGNCRSLAYLYKILADELGAKCWLALAPGHIYIRNYSRKVGWYNTELTSGSFPTDAWIATTGYVSTDAIRSGIYMDTLSNQQSIALCLLDLAKGYELQTRNYYDGFILKCCDLVLQYHPVNPMALLLKAETLKKVHVKQAEEKNPDATTTYAEMEKTYISLTKLHYREMPEKMYQDWLNSLIKNRDKYANKKVKQLVQVKKAK